MLLPVGLQAESPPDAVHCGMGELGFSRQRPAGPMGTIFGYGLEGPADEVGNLGITDRSRATRFGLIVQADEPGSGSAGAIYPRWDETVPVG